MITETTRRNTGTRIKSIDTTQVIDIDEIAKADGFPRFVKQLQGYGNYVAYSNGEMIRVYNPETGKKIHDYRPADVSPSFHNPFQAVPLTPAPLRSDIPLY